MQGVTIQRSMQERLAHVSGNVVMRIARTRAMHPVDVEIRDDWITDAGAVRIL